MEITVEWSDLEKGYIISHYVPDMYMIDPLEGNSDEDGFYETAVEPIVLDKLASMGISSEAIVC